ncbi:hypothetical protein J6590_086920, partial [Homalodisca vitripennis]
APTTVSPVKTITAATWNMSAKGFEPWDLLSTVSPRSVAKMFYEQNGVCESSKDVGDSKLVNLFSVN